MFRSVASISSQATADLPGLDPARYASNTGGQMAEKQFFTFESQISDKERFKDVDPLSLRCPSCQGSFAFEGLLEDTVSHCQAFEARIS
jgi:DNA polymerase alpha subunit A